MTKTYETETYETTYNLAVRQAQMITVEECRIAEEKAHEVSALSPEYRNAWFVANTEIAASNRKYHATVNAAFDVVHSARCAAAPESCF